MKLKIYISLLLVFGVVRTINAQECNPYTNADACEEGNGISTDPDNLINTECPNLVKL